MLKDQHDRKVNYLRVSITDRCNLRCLYCMPPQGIDPLERREILSYEEISEVVSVAVRSGITRVRITGGEPLVRKNVPHLVRALSRFGSLEEVSLTTNGVLLSDLASELKQSGLYRVNVSLDSLSREKFRNITRMDELPRVMLGIEKAIEVGLTPVKLNVVVMRGVNDDELESFGRLSQATPLHIRFIEYMQFGKMDLRNYFYPVSKMKDRLAKLGSLRPGEDVRGSGPAQYFRYENALGTVGFISPLSDSFCGNCNRLRLSADGKLRPCLLSDQELDLRTPLRNGTTRDEIELLIRKAVEMKPPHPRSPEAAGRGRPNMASIGG